MIEITLNDWLIETITYNTIVSMLFFIAVCGAICSFIVGFPRLVVFKFDNPDETPSIITCIVIFILCSLFLVFGINNNMLKDKLGVQSMDQYLEQELSADNVIIKGEKSDFESEEKSYEVLCAYSTGLKHYEMIVDPETKTAKLYEI